MRSSCLCNATALPMRSTKRQSKNSSRTCIEHSSVVWSTVRSRGLAGARECAGRRERRVCVTRVWPPASLMLLVMGHVGAL